MPRKVIPKEEPERIIAPAILEARSELFQAAGRLDNSTWSIQLAPPGHKYFRHEFLEQIEIDAADVRCALRKLRRAMQNV